MKRTGTGKTWSSYTRCFLALATARSPITFSQCPEVLQSTNLSSSLPFTDFVPCLFYGDFSS